jgi:hypothetical protein
MESVCRASAQHCTCIDAYQVESTPAIAVADLDDLLATTH